MMEPEMRFPLEITRLLGNTALQRESIGLSGAGVWMSPELVLKVQPEGPESRGEAAMMTWLCGKLPTPELVCRVIENGLDYQLMTRVPGAMACDPVYMSRPEKLAELLAESLHTLWSLDLSDCPCDQGLEVKVTAARNMVQQGRCDTEWVDPETYGPGGFSSPEDLLNWLEHNRPSYDPVLSHGDLCLPNIMLEHDRLSGFVDLGRAGISDRYQDIALCWRSMRDNYSGRYGTAWPGFKPELLFDALGMQPDWDKLRYYRLLDELF